MINNVICQYEKCVHNMAQKCMSDVLYVQEITGKHVPLCASKSVSRVNIPQSMGISSTQSMNRSENSELKDWYYMQDGQSMSQDNSQDSLVCALTDCAHNKSRLCSAPVVRMSQNALCSSYTRSR